MNVSVNDGCNRCIYKGNDCESWESIWIINGIKSMMNYDFNYVTTPLARKDRIENENN